MKTPQIPALDGMTPLGLTQKTQGHTKGPWEIGQGLETIENMDGEAICNMHSSTAFQIGLDLEANARLIAAAPELLEAVREYLALLKSDYMGSKGWLSPEGPRIEALIAKAEGRG